ncbi:YcnI family protein [Mycobacterium sp. pUA109]
MGAATLCLGSTIGVAPAWAHVHVSSPGAVRASTAMLTFQVPNESETGSATTELVVTLPDVASARTETMPGWAAKLDRDTAAGTVRSVTWTAIPGGGIGADQFGLFRISVKLPDADSVSFAATQKYADGTVVRWDQPPLPDGGEPEHPAPVLTLAPGAQSPAVGADRAQSADPSDNAARLLAGAALLVAALAVTVAITRRRT